MQFWSGSVISSLEPNEVFVFGSNPEGRHGAGAAKAAKRFGARYGRGRGLMGQSYALVTKNLTPGFFEPATDITYELAGPRSVSPEQIARNIDDLYALARSRPDLRFLMVYQNQRRASLNGYTGAEMWEMFSAERSIPSNIVFHDSFRPLAKAHLAETHLAKAHQPSGVRPGSEVTPAAKESPVSQTSPSSSRSASPRLVIRAHAASGYAPRTRENAASADLTIAVAADFTTAGERLTKKSAGANFLSLPIAQDPVVSARALYRALRDRGFAGSERRPVVNVAGNGIYTLERHGVDQAAANAHLFAIFQAIQPHLPIGMIISGGQTGVDFAGIVAGHALGIDTRMTLPAGFLQRGTDGVDVRRSEPALRAEVEAAVSALTLLAPVREPAET